MDLQKILGDIGLSEKEAQVYLTLLELHEGIPSVIARRAGVKRPTVYVILDQLKAKGLVSGVKRKGLEYFQAVTPHSLIEDQYNKYQALEDALPELLGLHQMYSATPQMSVFEGEEGLIKIMEDTLTTSGELYCWADVDLAVNSLKEYYPTYIRKKVERGIWLRGVLNDSALARKFAERGKEELREIYTVPAGKFPFKNEINIYDDKVAIVSHEDKVGVIIQNKNIADTQKSIFLLCFEYAKGKLHT